MRKSIFVENLKDDVRTKAIKEVYAALNIKPKDSVGKTDAEQLHTNVKLKP
jgi:hypothetical protein